MIIRVGPRNAAAEACRWLDHSERRGTASPIRVTTDAIDVHDPAAGDMTIPPASAWINGNIVEVTGEGLVRHEGKAYRAQRVIGLPEWRNNAAATALGR